MLLELTVLLFAPPLTDAHQHGEHQLHEACFIPQIGNQGIAGDARQPLLVPRSGY